jgi:hypothetical protein
MQSGRISVAPDLRALSPASSRPWPEYRRKKSEKQPQVIVVCGRKYLGVVSAVFGGRLKIRALVASALALTVICLAVVVQQDGERSSD